MTENIKALIANLYDDRVPIHKLMTLQPNFSAPKAKLAVLLFTGSPATPEESDSMEKKANDYVDLMLMADIFAVSNKEKQILVAGKFFKEFVEEAKSYLDSDNIIIRILGISRQDFDKLVNEYKEVSTGAKDIDSILSKWSDLSHESKLGILRGIFLQRSIMGGILMDIKLRNKNTVAYTDQTNKFIDTVMGVSDEPSNK